MGANLPIVLIEVVLIFGGVLAFAWWQLREIKIDQRKAAAERAEREARDVLEKARSAREGLDQAAAGHAGAGPAGSGKAPPPADNS